MTITGGSILANKICKSNNRVTCRKFACCLSGYKITRCPASLLLKLCHKRAGITD